MIEAKDILSNAIAIAIAVASAVFSLLMWFRAGRANKEAAKAADAARVSAEEARRTADIAEMTAHRGIERHDVRWKAKWDSATKVISIRNHGADEAHDVVVALVLGGQENFINAGTIASLDLESVDIANQWQAMEDTFALQNPTHSTMPLSLEMSGRMLWNSKLGSPHSQELDPKRLTAARSPV